MTSFSATDACLPLWVFNCSHELALANGHKNYYPPGNVRLMERELAPLAAWLAGEGAAVLVAEEDVALCRAFYRGRLEHVRFVSAKDLAGRTVDLHPWGLNSHVVWTLQKAGAKGLPSAEVCQTTARLTSRRTAVELLHRLLADKALPLCGAARFCESYEEAEEAVGASPHGISIQTGVWTNTILKAPISSSGRGLRYATGALEPPLSGWTRRVVAEQGGVVVEPFYRKLCDLAAEFRVTADGMAYLGLSHFRSDARCAYDGNLIGSQERLRREVFGEFPAAVYDEVTLRIIDHLAPILTGRYQGGVGVDMMLCQVDEEIRLHPCVEVNLRQTMGHVALRLAERFPEENLKLFQLLYEADPAVLQDRLKHLDGQLLTPAPEGCHYAAVLRD